MRFSPGFAEWLAGLDCSLVLSTYHSGKLITVGVNRDGQVVLDALDFGRCMGMAVDGAGFWASTTHQLWRFDRVHDIRDQDLAQTLFLPQLSFTTGLLNCHDLAVDGAGAPLFANTLFNCVATSDGKASFTPVWRPDFISELAAEDRCHLNGIATQAGALRLVTGFAAADCHDGWREHRMDGWMIDLERPGDMIRGLTQPHSPRIFGTEPWLLNSGAGLLGRVADGKFDAIFFHAGYPRGLSRIDDYLLVGLSKERKAGEFNDLPIGETLEKRGLSPGCGVDILDTTEGKVAHWLRFETVVTELFDVIVLRKCREPVLVSPNGPKVYRTYSIGQSEVFPHL